MTELSEKERMVLLKDWRGEELTEEELEILPIAKEKSDAIYRRLMETDFDVYIAGRLDADTMKRFDEMKKRLSELGLTVFSPFDVIQPSERKGKLDFHALSTAWAPLYRDRQGDVGGVN